MKTVSSLILSILLMGAVRAEAQTPSYYGAVFNETHSVSGTFDFLFMKEPVKRGAKVQRLHGFLDADGLPGGRVLCGMGAFKGRRTGQRFVIRYTSRDTDPGCGFDWGMTAKLSGKISRHKIRGRFLLSTRQYGRFVLDRR